MADQNTIHHDTEITLHIPSAGMKGIGIAVLVLSLAIAGGLFLYNSLVVPTTIKVQEGTTSIKKLSEEQLYKMDTALAKKVVMSRIDEFLGIFRIQRMTGETIELKELPQKEFVPQKEANYWRFFEIIVLSSDGSQRAKTPTIILQKKDGQWKRPSDS